MQNENENPDWNDDAAEDRYNPEHIHKLQVVTINSVQMIHLYKKEPQRN